MTPTRAIRGAAEPGGILYLVATPIGNLEDITLRAIRILREADVVACEDTRRTRGLLSHLDVHTPTISLHEHNEQARIPQILALLREGKRVALVSDAGTPAIADPGAALVAAAAREGLRIVPVPGASAVTAAVSLADFPAERFAFVGFLPRRGAERRRMLEAVAGMPLALVMFEAPHRVREALDDLARVFGERRLVLVRELTKVHEQVLRGTASEVRAALGEAARGEVTLVIEGAPPARAAARQSPEQFLRDLLARGLSRRDAARALEVAYGLPSREAYRMATGEG
ncbi:MAG: 16S rRNA (cytidine(1402)-2'-O)-methyltransferase [Armatimonadota bacterium]|nr:16S rRNA (cytidine(1402)-2'-O)-methyltransferase [Armatimonadota bacterium]